MTSLEAALFSQVEAFSDVYIALTVTLTRCYKAHMPSRVQNIPCQPLRALPWDEEE